MDSRWAEEDKHVVVKFLVRSKVIADCAVHDNFFVNKLFRLKHVTYFIIVYV